MAQKSKITIKSRLVQDHSSDITIGSITYHVQTEDRGKKAAKIVSRIYREGEVVFSRTSDYANLLQLTDFPERLNALMGSHHKTTIQMFHTEQGGTQSRQAEYLEGIQHLLRKGQNKVALNSTREALSAYPEDIIFKSYYGYLISVVENNTGEGLKLCKDAISALHSGLHEDSEILYPLFYLNLGRAFLKGNNKKEAIEAFQRGLKIDPDHKGIKWELKKLGSRKKPPLSFLDRSNPLNIFLGKLMNKSSK